MKQFIKHAKCSKDSSSSSWRLHVCSGGNPFAWRSLTSSNLLCLVSARRAFSPADRKLYPFVPWPRSHQAGPDPDVLSYVSERISTISFPAFQHGRAVLEYTKVLSNDILFSSSLWVQSTCEMEGGIELKSTVYEDNNMKRMNQQGIIYEISRFTPPSKPLYMNTIAGTM